MIVQEIIDFVKDRTGEGNVDYLLRETTAIVNRVWNSTDYPGSLQIMQVAPASSQERYLILPWYVASLRGVQKGPTGEVTLYNPQHFVHDNSRHQWPLQWRVIGPTPLLRSYVNIGRLTLRLRAPANEVFSVTLNGPGEFGVTYDETIEFAVGDTEHTTDDVFKDLHMLGKNVRVTQRDVMVYDISGICIAVLPASRDIVQNLRVQLMDDCAMECGYPPQNCYTILFKTHPPVITGVGSVLDDMFGDVIRNLVTAQILSKVNDTAAMNRMKFHGAQGEQLMDQALRQKNMGVQQVINVGREPFGHEFYGWL